MSVAELEEMLHRYIPLSRQMGIAVAKLDERRVELAAEAETNRNHRGTIFGGSMISLALLAGWAMLLNAVGDFAIAQRLVVKNTKVDFLQPARLQLRAVCLVPARELLQEFVQRLSTNDKATMAVNCSIYDEDNLAARVESLYIAIPS